MVDYQKIWTEWAPLATKWAFLRAGLSPCEILAIVIEESDGNVAAVNEADPSYGLMGVSLLIGKQYASVNTANRLYDPDTNVKAGSGYLGYLKFRYAKNFPIGAARNGWPQCYNLGETRFLKGERAPGYEEAFIAHLSALNPIAQQAVQSAAQAKL